MGAIADAMVAYAQPLFDETDGSPEQIRRAMLIAQFCWNLAVSPEEDLESALADLQSTLKMDADEFEEFQRAVVLPMLERHYEMFPDMPRMGEEDQSQDASSPPTPVAPLRSEKYPGTGRNAPCPCNSGKKYKRCCGQ